MCLLALGMTATPSFANVFAAHLSAAGSEWNFSTQGNLTITYRLNQPATSVTIEIYRVADPATVVKTIAGTTTWGLNTVVWDGTQDGGGLAPKSGVRSDQGRGLRRHSSWTNITPWTPAMRSATHNYYAPVGIAINRDQQAVLTRYTYRPTQRVNQSWSQRCGEGLFLLNSDMSFRGDSAATAAAA